MEKQKLLLDRAAFIQWKFGEDDDDWKSAADLIIDSLSTQNEVTISLDELLEEADMIPFQCVNNVEELSQEFKDKYCDMEYMDNGDFYEISAPGETYYVEWE